MLQLIVILVIVCCFFGLFWAIDRSEDKKAKQWDVVIEGVVANVEDVSNAQTPVKLHVLHFSHGAQYVHDGPGDVSGLKGRHIRVVRNGHGKIDFQIVEEIA